MRKTKKTQFTQRNSLFYWLTVDSSHIISLSPCRSIPFTTFPLPSARCHFFILYFSEMCSSTSSSTSRVSSYLLLTILEKGKTVRNGIIYCMRLCQCPCPCPYYMFNGIKCYWISYSFFFSFLSPSCQRFHSTESLVLSVRVQTIFLAPHFLRRTEKQKKTEIYGTSLIVFRFVVLRIICTAPDF